MEILLSIYLGSDSDVEQFKKGFALLDKWQLPYRLHILSAHRTPEALAEAMTQDEKDGCHVFMAGAGMAAHLPGVVASKTIKPVIGVPLASGPMNGTDALHSIVQMPPGIPVGTMAIGSAGAQNGVIFAAQILGGPWQEKAEAHRRERAEQVLAKERQAQEQGYKAFLS
jgi:5-(carboxyamino)imidazole ribonucleotide mutase